MLMLTRKKNESIIIGDNEIKITIKNVDRGVVKLGIEADKKIKIHREELYKQLKGEINGNC